MPWRRRQIGAAGNEALLARQARLIDHHRRISPLDGFCELSIVHGGGAYVFRLRKSILAAPPSGQSRARHRTKSSLRALALAAEGTAIQLWPFPVLVGNCFQDL
jgi:hypothetical protein